MCISAATAMALAGAAAGAGGEMLGQGEQGKQANALINAQNTTLGNILAKNDPLAAENRAGFNTRVEGYAPEAFQGQQQDLTTSRSDAAKANITPSGPVDVPILSSAPSVVQAEFDKRAGEASNKSSAKADALGEFGGFGDVFLRQDFANEGTRRDFSVNNDLMRGNLAILPHLQQYSGLAAMKPMSPIPGILKGVGSALGSFAGGKG